MATQPGDHPALVFLDRELLPFLIAGQLVDRRWFVRLAWVSAYASDFAAALAGLGFGGPLGAAIANIGGANGGAQSDLSGKLKLQLGPVWYYVGVAAIVAWLVVRLVVQNERVSQRATLARQFVVDNAAADQKTTDALRGHAPRQALLEIKRATDARVQAALAGDIWLARTWQPPPETYQVERDRRIDNIRRDYMPNWNPPKEGEDWI